MEKKNRYPLVNWMDGMNVRRIHQIQTEDHFTNALCEGHSIGLNKHNYGLLPYYKGSRASGNFDISEQVTGTVEVRLKRCYAVTSGGYLINFDADEENSLVSSFSLTTEELENGQDKDRKWDVILMADPFERVPVGTPDEKEKSPRHPDALPKYMLNVLPSGQINVEELGRHYLVIGRLQKRGNRYEVDGNFIPPCTSMSSHPDLKEYYAKFGQFIDTIERASKDIILKVQNVEKQSPLAVNIDMICKNIMLYISSIYFLYRNEGQFYSPLRFINVFSVLAHTCFVSLNFMSKVDKEELLKYFYEWSDVTPGTFETLLSENTGIIYDHNNIRGLMVTTERFLYLFNDLWITLSRLEYIGKHKENIVVAERSKRQGDTSTSRWSLID